MFVAFAGITVQIKREFGTGGLVDQVLGLGFTYGDAVEGDIVVHSLGVEDEPVEVENQGPDFGVLDHGVSDDRA